MTIQYVPLSAILPNPYQTRESEDPEHIKNLAESIEAHGLMQNAVGTHLGYPQVVLAFGHSRLAAFKLLSSQGKTQFDCFPINVIDLDDAQLFEMAVAENLERRDLTPIEEAKAMQRYMVEFKKNSKEVGELFHLSDSAVRNKLRLLGLPAEAQEHLNAGEITEGTARELLGWYELPQDWREERNKRYDGNIEKKVFNGAGSEYLKNEIKDLLRWKANELHSSLWKWDEDLQGKGIIGLCKGCPNNMEREKKAYCTLKSCFLAKKQAWIKNYLSQASLLSGIQTIEEEKFDTPSYSLNTFSSYNSQEQETLRKSIDGQCENLRLIFEEHPNASSEKDRDYLAGIGFAHARIICGKRNGFCTCKKAASKGVDIKTEDGTIDQERLKEIHRLEREQVKLNKQRIAEMKSMTKTAILQAIRDQQLKAWQELTSGLFYESEYSDQIKSATSVDQVQYAMICHKVNHKVWNDDPKDALKHVNELLVSMELDPLDIEIEPEEPKGKTLMEVFAKEEE